MGYKVIFIDWYRTLSSSLFYVDNLHQNQGVGVCNYFRYKTFENNEEMIEKWIRGKISHKEIIAKFAKDDAEYKMALEMLKNSCYNMQFDRECFIPLIQKIRKRGVKVVIATDNMNVFTDWVVPSLNLREYFDDIISSNVSGYKKMDIVSEKLVFFDAFLKKNKMSYEDALMVDDSFQTIISCQKCGMHVHQVKSSNDVEYILRKLAGEN